MITLLKAEDILNVGLTCTQVFYLVGKRATKGLCRFVKTDSIKTAIATLLSIKGTRRLVEDVRLNDLGGLKVWTDQGIENLPRIEVRAFLTRYNQLATAGCNSECKCADDPENMWKQFCVHKIAEHLQGVKEKLEAIASVTEAVKTIPLPVQRLLSEAKDRLNREGLTWIESEEDGDFLLKVCKSDSELGHIIIAADAKIFVSVQRQRERHVFTLVGAVALLMGGIQSPPKSQPSNEEILGFLAGTIFDTRFQNANRKMPNLVMIGRTK